MSKTEGNPGLTDIERAKREAEMARRRLASTAGALQARLKPSNLANNAWEGVKDKSGDLADEAIQAVKERPLTASGVAAGIVLFLARDSIWSAGRSLFRKKRNGDLVTTRIADDDPSYDLAAPLVSRSLNEGVSA